MMGFPTCCDIYIESSGKRVATVLSYKASESATLHTLILTRIYTTEEAISDGINIYNLENFSLVIIKPDKKIVYTDCRWGAIDEHNNDYPRIAERAKAVSAQRMESEAVTP